MNAPQTFARNMRSAPTDAESVLWRHLRAHRLGGYKFKRQQPLGKYIVDFVCFDRKIIVEVDGGQHNESPSDRARDLWLRSQGFVVLRFWNNEVLLNAEGVVTWILGSLAPSASVPLPRGEREAYWPGVALEAASWSSLPTRGGGTEGEGA